MSKIDLQILANLFSDMNDFIDQIIPPKSWMSSLLRQYLFCYRDELINRILQRQTFNRYKGFKGFDFKRIAQSKKCIERLGGGDDE